MSLENAKRYYEVIDDAETDPSDLSDLYAPEAVLRSPREGVFRGRDGVTEFYRRNESFFAAGAHHMTDFHVDGDTVVCEGTVSGETTAGRRYDGVGLADVFEFHDGLITAHRIYLDYSAIYRELPADEDVPTFR
jgi:ketosteroid isomerase-like protein